MPGGLSFSCIVKPDSNTIGDWINTLYVAPEYRNRGIGANLVKAAETEARKQAVGELFVFTDIPGIYTRSGWDTVKIIEGSMVLARVLPN
ncbi:MAG: hypothetical protein PsegKO_30530 [Pseudohongiellaceae bacterium]